MKRPSRDRLRPLIPAGSFCPVSLNGHLAGPMARKIDYLFSFIFIYSRHIKRTWLEKSLSDSFAIFSIFSISSFVNRIDFTGSP